MLSTVAPGRISLAGGGRSRRRTRPGAASISDFSRLETSLRIAASCRLQAELDGQVHFRAQPARGGVQLLEHRRHGLAGFECGAQLADRGFHLAEHDRHRHRIGRFGDARGNVALGDASGETNELPRRRKSVHQQHETVADDVGLARRVAAERLRRTCGIDMHLGLLDHLALEDAHVVVRQPLGQVGEHVADFKHMQERCDVVGRPRRADLNGEPALRLLVGADGCKSFPHAQDGALVQRADQLIGLGLIVGEQGAIDVLGQRLGLGRNQIAADPAPDRLERKPRDATNTLVVGGSVDQEWLERHEEQVRRVADARHALRLGADGAPQFVEHQLAASHIVAAQLGALELCNQHRPRFRLEVSEIFPQPFDGLPVARHRTRL